MLYLQHCSPTWFLCSSRLRSLESKMVDNLTDVVKAPITFLLPVRIRGCDQSATPILQVS